MKDKAAGTIALDGVLWLHWILHTWRRVIQVFLLPIFVTVLFIIGLGLLYFYFREPRWWVRWVWSVAFGGLGVVGITTGFDWVVLRIWDLWLRHHVDVQAPFRANENIYESLPELVASLKEAGFQKAKVVVGIDYSKSNDFTGRLTNNARPLHDINEDGDNAYQQVIKLLGCPQLGEFVDSSMVYCFGFSDAANKDQFVLPMCGEEGYCVGFEGVLDAYNRVTPTIEKGGPTSFAPVIREAMNLAKEKREHHIVFIITDGQVVDEQDSRKAVVAASRLPISIVVIGVGDGPWEVMEEFDDHLPKRLFDNLQFVRFENLPWGRRGKDETEFTLMTMMEIPAQYRAISNLQSKYAQPQQHQQHPPQPTTEQS